jgi:hypothetical protein
VVVVDSFDRRACELVGRVPAAGVGELAERHAPIDPRVVRSSGLGI